MMQMTKKKAIMTGHMFSPASIAKVSAVIFFTAVLFFASSKGNYTCEDVCNLILLSEDSDGVARGACSGYRDTVPRPLVHEMCIGTFLSTKMSACMKACDDNHDLIADTCQQSVRASPIGPKQGMRACRTGREKAVQWMASTFRSFSIDAGIEVQATAVSSVGKDDSSTQAAKEEARRAKEAEEETARSRAQEEARRDMEAEEKAAQIRAQQEEESRKAREAKDEEARRAKEAEEEAARIRAAAAEEEARRQAAEAEATRIKQEEEESSRKATEDAARIQAEEDEAARLSKVKEDKEKVRVEAEEAEAARIREEVAKIQAEAEAEVKRRMAEAEDEAKRRISEEKEQELMDNTPKSDIP